MQLSNRTKQKIGKSAFAVFRTLFLIGMAYVLLFPILVMITRAITILPKPTVTRSFRLLP